MAVSPSCRRAPGVSDGGGGRLQALVEEFKHSSPEFGRWWDSHDVREQRSRLRRFRHPEHGEQTMRLIVVRAPEFVPCFVAFHLPVQGS